jgi:signal transduction histidine kinase/DNA-binding NarL/FixJ family response regulator
LQHNPHSVMAKPLTSFFDRFRQGACLLVRPGQDQVADEQLRLVWSHARIGVLVAAAFAISLGLTLRGIAAPARLVDAWLALKLGISLYRGWQGWHSARRAPHGQRWARPTFAALVVDGAVWGAAGLYVTLWSPWTVTSVVCAMLACIACVATFGLQASARYTAAYVAPMLLPTAIGLLLRDDVFGELASLGMLMLLGLQLTTAVRSEQRLTEGVRLRLQAEALAQEKEDALKAAMRQSAVKTQFLANISHELRTPLHGILGMAHLLQLELHDAPRKRRVELIESSGAHLLTLINDLLDISRIEAGQFVFRSERHELNAQIEQLVGIYSARTQDKGLSLTVRNELPSPCWVMGDPARFRQVLHNLLGNAIKFTAHGGITLHIALDAASGLVRAEVQDTGLGIAEQDLDKIFEAFQQSDSGASTPASEGVGLGLTIARDIARAMGGEITARSHLGEGATLVFTARLPLVGPPSELQPAQPTEPALAPSGGALRACRVLLAEDNDINALVAINFLEIVGGVMVERVNDGQAAVDAAMREPRPDLVLMDCHMPVLDGYEATGQIRLLEQQGHLARLPIIALTATASDAERQDCLSAGMDDFLSKPCSLEDLRHVIQSWARHAVNSPDGAAASPVQEPSQAPVPHEAETAASPRAPSPT